MRRYGNGVIIVTFSGIVLSFLFLLFLNCLLSQCITACNISFPKISSSVGFLLAQVYPCTLNLPPDVSLNLSPIHICCIAYLSLLFRSYYLLPNFRISLWLINFGVLFSPLSFEYFSPSIYILCICITHSM